MASVFANRRPLDATGRILAVLDSNAFAIGPKRFDMPDRARGPISSPCARLSDHLTQRIVFPPSTTRFAPLIIAAASLARNMAAYAISLGFAKRPTGISARASLPFSPFQKRAVISVSTTVGEMALTVTPRGPHSTAMDRSIPSKPAFDAA